MIRTVLVTYDAPAERFVELVLGAVHLADGPLALLHADHATWSLEEVTFLRSVWLFLLHSCF